MFQTSKMPTALIVALTLTTATGSAQAQAQAQGRPNADFNGNNATFDLAPGSQLRAGDRLTDRLLYSVWQRVTVKGTGLCSTRACPVQFNGETVYARLPQLTIASGGSQGGGGGTPGEPRRRLQRGDKGEDVRRLQEALNKEGARLTVDSSYGRGTEMAVEEYQRRKRLKVDGIAGRETLQLLGV